MLRSLYFGIIVSPLVILGQVQKVPVNIGGYVTTITVPESVTLPSSAPVTVIIQPETSPLQAPARRVNMAPSASTNTYYPGYVYPPPGYVSPPPGVIVATTTPHTSIAATTATTQVAVVTTSGNALSVFSSEARSLSSAEATSSQLQKTTQSSQSPQTTQPVATTVPSAITGGNALSVFSSEAKSLSLIETYAMPGSMTPITTVTVSPYSSSGQTYTTAHYTSATVIPASSGSSSSTGIISIASIGTSSVSGIQSGVTTTITRTSNGETMTVAEGPSTTRVIGGIVGVSSATETTSITTTATSTQTSRSRNPSQGSQLSTSVATTTATSLSTTTSVSTTVATEPSGMTVSGVRLASTTPAPPVNAALPTRIPIALGGIAAGILAVAGI